MTTQSAALVSPVPQPAVQPAAPVTLEPEPKKIQDEIAYSVIHHHLSGTCTGRLKISGDLISFWPSGDSKDGFTRTTKQINDAELADKLTIRFKDQTYRFEALARDNEGNHRNLVTLYQHLKRQMAQTRR